MTNYMVSTGKIHTIKTIRIPSCHNPCEYYVVLEWLIKHGFICEFIFPTRLIYTYFYLKLPYPHTYGHVFVHAVLIVGTILTMAGQGATISNHDLDSFKFVMTQYYKN